MFNFMFNLNVARKLLGVALVAMLAVAVGACAGETIIKEVEVPGATVIQEKIVEVEVPGETIIQTVEKVVEVEVPGATVIQEKIVEVEVPGATVIQEKIVKVAGETVIQEKLVEVEVPGETVIKEVVTVVTVVATPTPVPVSVGQFLAPPGEYHSFTWDGAIPTTFNEAPMLAAKVAVGDLPPVSERLPDREDVLIVKPAERIGEYGGTWHRLLRGASDGQNIDRVMHDLPIEDDNDATTPVPNIIKSWANNADFTVFTMTLRKGMRWSDGALFTADDFVYAHDHQTRNSDLHGGFSALKDSVTGDAAVITKIDDQTFTYTFTNPKPRFIEQYNGGQGGMSLWGRLGGGYFAPKHYMSQFHNDLGDAATLLATIKDAGFDSWTQLYKDRGNPLVNSDLPVVSPWVVISPITSEVYAAERNPYYFAVDPEGNQLPYIDRLVAYNTPNTEVLNLRAIAGDVDMMARHMHVAKIPLFIDNQEKGNYTITIYGMGAGGSGLIFNQTWDGDDELEKWIQTKNFRIAVSHAINRDTLNEIIYLGIGRPAMGYNPLSIHSPGDAVGLKYESYATFDTDTANQLLDDMGLTAKDSDGYRLRTDGSGDKLVVPLSFTPVFADQEAIAEIVIENLRAVGVYAEADSLERDLYSTRRDNNELAINLGAGIDAGPSQFGTGSNNFGTYGAWLVGPAWSINYADSALGVVPTNPDILRLRELWVLGNDLPIGERVVYAKEALEINMNNVWHVGFVGYVPCGRCILVKKNFFKNVPALTSLDGNWPGEARPEQFFIDR